ncbi:MAG: peptidylprolyl isomerase [Flavobacteriales bacterium]|nr:peptidylprolyl isomerase [Flavobacteriales bacterium]
MTPKKLLAAAFCGLCITYANAQNGSTDPVLMTVDRQPVTRAEFEAIYKKNNKEASVTKEALDEYLELFINYKLKVREAETLGMDTIGKFRNELDGYRKQLARPYLIDRELNDALMREAYDRSTQEVRASHILLQVPPDASPEDTMAVWKRITALRDRIMNGEDFATVAKGVGGSEDPSAQKNGGDLGWFSALQMVYPFENAAYNTPEGTVSQPVRTRFGYHMVKVTGRRPARGQMKVAHIMLRSTDQDSPEKQAERRAAHPRDPPPARIERHHLQRGRAQVQRGREQQHQGRRTGAVRHRQDDRGVRGCRLRVEAARSNERTDQVALRLAHHPLHRSHSASYL